MQKPEICTPCKTTEAESAWGLFFAFTPALSGCLKPDLIVRSGMGPGEPRGSSSQPEATHEQMLSQSPINVVYTAGMGPGEPRGSSSQPEATPDPSLPNGHTPPPADVSAPRFEMFDADAFVLSLSLKAGVVVVSMV